MEKVNDDDIPEPTNELSKGIKPIAKDTVHKICSGQVVLSLAVAVKELVENSIDAGATLVEVKLKNQGIESVEVSDNGSGVEETNLIAMTAKYHTSKLREFTDLQGIETFGFRGEALSSLCSLSDMVIITRHSSSQIGVRVELDNEGKTKKKIPCARQVGTTVILSNLFSTLPVRKRDFIKNIKKEFAKMCQILQAYCLVSTNVRIMCTNINPKGSKTILMATNCSQSVVDNIQAIFGTRQMNELIELKPPMKNDEKVTKEELVELDDTNSVINVTEDDIDKLNLLQYKIEGWISSCSHGCGRSSKDRQYFYINSRPCDPKNLIKIVNETYHRYNVNQFPFIYLNVIIDRSDVDVNLTPDKRQLLVANEKILILAVRKSLLNTFSNIPSTFKFQNTLLETFLEKSVVQDTNSDDDEIKVEPNSQKFKEVLSQWKLTGDTLGPSKPLCNTKRKVSDEINQRSLKLRKIQEFLTSNPVINTDVAFPNSQGTDSVVSYKSESESDEADTDTSFNVSKVDKFSKEFDMITSTQLNANKEFVERRIDCKTISKSTPLKSSIIVDRQSLENISKENSANDSTQQNKNVEQIIQGDDKNTDSIAEKENVKDASICSEYSESSRKRITLDIRTEDVDNSTLVPPSNNKINTTIDEIRKLAIAEESAKINCAQAKLDYLKFKSLINPTENKNAEKELQKEISKEMFSHMDIIGQFNLGFIIVKLDQDVFIVDQHASDEKYNFEDLQKTTVLQSQNLTVPQNLELTAINEMILIDNLEIFAKNGFKFQIDETANTTKKVKLVAKPYSKNWEFGKEDIEELIFMLQDAPEDTICRPSRIRSMFASRACRKSVMVGKSLSKSDMKQVITHMGEIEQPWNCPHGRPTMRHLINLAMLNDQQDDK